MATEEKGPWEDEEDGPWNEKVKTASAAATAEPPSDEEIEAAYGKDVSPKIRAAVKSGVAPMKPPTKFEQDRPQIKENYGFTPGNVAKNAVEGAAGLVKSGAEGLYDIGFGQGKDEEGNIKHGVGGLVGINDKGEFAPMERLNALTQKYVTDPAVAEWNKGTEEGGLAGIGHKALSTIPLVGPWAGSIGEQAGTGDIGGATGQVAGQVALGELAHHAPALADKVVRGTPLTEAGKLAAAKEQALTVKKPSMTETEYSAKVQAAMPDLQKVAQDNAGKIKTPRDAVGAINRRVQEMEAPIGEHLKGLNRPEDMVHVDQYHDQIDKAIDAEMAKHPGQLTAAEIEKAKTQIDKFVGDQPKTLEEVEGNRKRLNQDAEDYYKSRPADKRVMDSSDATAIAQRAAANAIRSILYGDDANPGLLEKAGVTAVDQAGNQVPLREFRQKVGNLLEVRDHFEDAIVRAEQTGNWKAFDKLHSGSSLAAGGLGAIGGLVAGGPIGALFGTLAGEGVKAWGDYLRSKNPNLNVQKMFRNLEATGKPNTIEPVTKDIQHQYQNAIGPQTSDFAEPIGPARPPGNFQMEELRPNQDALWQQQVGQPQPLETGAPSPGRHVEPIGPQPQAEAPLGPIQGQQIPLHLPSGPEEAPLFGIEHPAPRARTSGAPEAPAEPPAAVGGPGREGTLGRIDLTPQKTSIEDLKVGDTFVDDKGDPRRITDITEDGTVKTADHTMRDYKADEIEHLGEINSPRAQLARGGMLHVGDEEGREMMFAGNNPEHAAEFHEAVKNTPGARLNKDGSVTLTISRRQLPEQAGERSIRSGVFFSPEEKSPFAKSYTGKSGYGGPMKIVEQDVTFKNPILSKGATGGKVPERVYDELKGKNSYQEMRKDVLDHTGTLQWNKPSSAELAQRVGDVLEKYGADRDYAEDIIRNSKKGSTLPYAIQEHIVAQAVRDAGYDAVLGYSKTGGQPRLSELFDVNRKEYPWRSRMTEIGEKSDRYDLGEIGGTETPRGEEVAPMERPTEGNKIGEPERKEFLDAIKKLGGDTELADEQWHEMSEEERAHALDRYRGQLEGKGPRTEPVQSVEKAIDALKERVKDRSHKGQERDYQVAPSGEVNPRQLYQTTFLLDDGSALQGDMGIKSHMQLAREVGQHHLNDANAIRIVTPDSYELHGMPSEAQLAEMNRYFRELPREGRQNVHDAGYVYWDFYPKEVTGYSADAVHADHATGAGSFSDFRRAIDEYYSPTTTVKVSPDGSSVKLMENPLDVKGSGEKGRVTTSDLLKAFNKYTKQAVGKLSMEKAEPAEMVERAKSFAEDEARYQLARDNSGAAWYTKQMDEHDAVAQQMRPDLRDPAKLSMFKMAEAILSAGQKPYGNFKSAMKAWDVYAKTGKFSERNPATGNSWGPRAAIAYGNAFGMLNKLIEEHGEQGASDWLLSDHPVSELRKYNESVSGKMDSQRPGVLILGEKRGPFAQNLHKIESAFTADMWVARTWNRWMGTAEIDPETGDPASDAPRNDSERALMREAFDATAEKLGLSTSALQAVMWYYEQALHGAHGVPKESWSFSDAAKRASDEEAEIETKTLSGKAIKRKPAATLSPVRRKSS